MYRVMFISDDLVYDGLQGGEVRLDTMLPQADSLIEIMSQHMPIVLIADEPKPTDSLYKATIPYPTTPEDFISACVEIGMQPSDVALVTGNHPLEQIASSLDMRVFVPVPWDGGEGVHMDDLPVFILPTDCLR